MESDRFIMPESNKGNSFTQASPEGFTQHYNYDPLTKGYLRSSTDLGPSNQFAGVSLGKPALPSQPNKNAFAAPTGMFKGTAPVTASNIQGRPGYKNWTNLPNTLQQPVTPAPQQQTNPLKPMFENTKIMGAKTADGKQINTDMLNQTLRYFMSQGYTLDQAKSELEKNFQLPENAYAGLGV